MTALANSVSDSFVMSRYLCVFAKTAPYMIARGKGGRGGETGDGGGGGGCPGGGGRGVFCDELSRANNPFVVRYPSVLLGLLQTDEERCGDSERTEQNKIGRACTTLASDKLSHNNLYLKRRKKTCAQMFQTLLHFSLCRRLACWAFTVL